MTPTPRTPGRAATLLALLALAAAPAAAQSGAGTAAAEFLSIPVGARASAMGGAFAATANDGTALYWNPSGITALDRTTFTVEHTEWLVGLDFNYVSFVLPTRLGTVGASITALSVPEMERTTDATNDSQLGTGETFSAGSYAVGLSYARDLTDRFAIGGTVKVVHERIYTTRATGFGVDIGTMFQTPFPGVRLGASISNFGTKMQLDGPALLVPVDVDPDAAGNNNTVRGGLRTDAFSMPLTMRVGVATDVFRQAGSRLTLAVDALSPSSSEQHLNLGGEAGFLNDLVMVRGGYHELFNGESVRTFSLGGGLRYAFGPLDLQADYAYEQFRYLNGTNRFTLALRF